MLTRPLFGFEVGLLHLDAWPRLLQNGWLVCVCRRRRLRRIRRLGNSVLMVVGGGAAGGDGADDVYDVCVCPYTPMDATN